MQERDCQTQQKFLLCEYNRDGDSYRSPWSNIYHPPLDGFKPSDKLRKLEDDANKIFDVYRHQYFEGGASSVYMWDLDHGFGACFCIQKDVIGDYICKDLQGFRGQWNSTHVFEVVHQQGKNDSYNYILTSTVFVTMPLQLKGLGDIDLSGTITKQAQKVCNVIFRVFFCYVLCLFSVDCVSVLLSSYLSSKQH